MKVINYEEFKRLLLEERKKIPLTAPGHAVQHVKHGIKIALRCLERCQDISTDLLFIAQPKWISCVERLPTEGVSIEMFFPVSQSICLGYYREIAKQSFWCVQFPDGTGRLGDEKPTHWRYRYITEKPQPPKGDE